MSSKNKARCSFCGRNELDAKKMIFKKNDKDTHICICDKCIILCKDIIAEQISQEESSDSDQVQNMKPRQIKVYLDKRVIGQNFAKIALSVAIYNHYKRIHSKDNDNQTVLHKGNILMIGPTGCGKTLLAQSIAKILDVPFTVADATTLTEAGYVGEDVENIIKNLWLAAGKDIEKAERGIVCIDEIDKIATKGGSSSSGRDVGGEGVQQALLKVIESGVISIPTDPSRTRPQNELIQIDTTNILFICTGAFNGLRETVERRVGTSTLGFNANFNHSEKENNAVLRQVEAEDLIKFGLIPELVGRIPVLVPLEQLDEDALYDILWRPTNAILKQYRHLFKLEGVTLTIPEDAMRAIVREAAKRKSGARGLRAVLEEIMLDIMYELPSLEGAVEVVITEDVVSHKSVPEIHYTKQAS